MVPDSVATVSYFQCKQSDYFSPFSTESANGYKHKKSVSRSNARELLFSLGSALFVKILTLCLLKRVVVVVVVVVVVCVFVVCSIHSDSIIGIF